MQVTWTPVSFETLWDGEYIRDYLRCEHNLHYV